MKLPASKVPATSRRGRGAAHFQQLPANGYPPLTADPVGSGRVGGEGG
ncbi:MAG TPA: hypothetical protein VK453_05435 [Micromonosporaceae bacterium]|nr:hypothetical protein [Micromonosporaceae bacterium]